MKAGRKRGAALAMACLISFCGCGVQESAKKPSPTHAVKTLLFTVSRNFDRELVEQAGLFADNVERISGGRLLINLMETEGETLLDSEYDLACLKNSQVARFDPTLATLALPFLYNDAPHLSLALNSPDMKKNAAQKLQGRLVPLAALSSGNALLVSTKAPQKNDMTNGSLMPVYFQDTVLAMQNNVEGVMAFKALGARVAPMAQASLTGQLGQEAAVYPGGQDSSETAVINAMEVTMEQLLAMSAGSEALYVLETRHDLEPVWLAMREDPWKGLSSWEQAVVQEAAASLIAGYEDNRGRYYATWEKEAGKRGIETFPTERQALTATIYDSGNGSAYFLLPAYFDKKLFDLVQSYS